MYSSAAAEVLYKLESGGHKLTKLRQAVIDIFSRRQKPLLLEELGGILRDRFIRVHRATLYRELDFLIKKNVIVQVSLEEGKLRYEFADRAHHHHAVCTKCKKIEDIELEDDIALLKRHMKTKNNFAIIRHTLEFFGLCGECQNV